MFNITRILFSIFFLSISCVYATQNFSVTILNNKSDQYICYDFDSTLNSTSSWNSVGSLTGKGCISPGSSKKFSNITDTLGISGGPDTVTRIIYVPTSMTVTGTDYNDSNEFDQLSFTFENVAIYEFAYITGISAKTHEEEQVKLLLENGNDDHDITITFEQEYERPYNGLILTETNGKGSSKRQKVSPWE